jgi:hypothetical protein
MRNLLMTWRAGLHACRYAAPKGMGVSSLAAAGHTVAAGAEGCVCLWDRRSAQPLACFDDTHPEAVTQACARPSQPSPLAALLASLLLSSSASGQSCIASCAVSLG